MEGGVPCSGWNRPRPLGRIASLDEFKGLFQACMDCEDRGRWVEVDSLLALREGDSRPAVAATSNLGEPDDSVSIEHFEGTLRVNALTIQAEGSERFIKLCAA